LCLMEIEPYWLYSYWEITPECRQKALKQLRRAETDGQWVLRFYDITGTEFHGQNAHDYFDVQIDLDTGNWYVNLWSGGKSYVAEVGIRKGDRFLAVCRSNVVCVPFTGPSPLYQPQWLRVEGAFDRVEGVPEPVTLADHASPPSVPVQEELFPGLDELLQAAEDGEVTIDTNQVPAPIDVSDPPSAASSDFAEIQVQERPSAAILEPAASETQAKTAGGTPSPPAGSQPETGPKPLYDQFERLPRSWPVFRPHETFPTACLSSLGVSAARDQEPTRKPDNHIPAGISEPGDPSNEK